MTIKDLDNVLAAAKQQLTRVLGSDRAQQIVANAYKVSGLKSVGTAADLLLFADALVAEGGFIEVVGRGLKVEALLRGARTSASQAVGALRAAER
jgi:hypothetical protein